MSAELPQAPAPPVEVIPPTGFAVETSRPTLGGRVWTVYTAIRNRWWRLSDPKRLREARERVVFTHLQESGFLEAFRGSRILEIGPKHGEDSRLLATLEPSELVLLDLPEKDAQVQAWLPTIEELCPTRHVSGNLLYLQADALAALGKFELVWCLGVLYHNVEQLRLLRRLFHLTSSNGAVVVESSTTRNRRLAGLNVVEIHWPDLYRGERTITHHPSRLAIKSWLEMAGFENVQIQDVYSRATRWQRAVLTAVRPLEPHPYLSYVNDRARTWVAGDAL